MNREELIEKYKSYGCKLIAVGNNKKPIPIKGKWKIDEEYPRNMLLAAPYIGIDHEASGTIDLDFDDKTLNAHKFSSSLPATHSIGKKYNGSGIATSNHFLYFKPDDVEIKTESFPKTTKGKGKKIIELLPNTQSRYIGNDLHITNDIPPKRLTESEFQQVRQTVKEIYFMAKAVENYPEENFRNDYALRLAGVLAKHTEWSLEKKEEIIRRIAEAANDDDVPNRVSRVGYQEKQLKAGETIYGIPELVEFLGAEKGSLDWIDQIKTKEFKEYPLVNAKEFLNNKYPEPKFLMFPIFSERSSNQIYGGYESGKTMFGLSASMYMCSGVGFAGFESRKKAPTLYVEGELPAAMLRERFNSIMQGMQDRGVKFNWDWHFILTKDDLEKAGFKYGFDPIAVSRNLSNPDAKDYGRRGREHISTLIRKIERKTGVKPFFNLDNVTALADIDENRAQDWTPRIQWLIHEKNKGFANCYYHHANKKTLKGGSSGSNAKERLLDTSMAFEKLDQKHRFNMGGNKNVQCRVQFDKSRNFGGSVHDKEFILTCNEDGEWKRYPYLDKYDFMIIAAHNKGYSIKDITKIKELEKKLEEKTIYKRHKKLRDLGIIK